MLLSLQLQITCHCDAYARAQGVAQEAYSVRTKHSYFLHHYGSVIVFVSIQITYASFCSTLCGNYLRIYLKGWLVFTWYALAGLRFECLCF